MSHRRYPEYKESGVEWIGEIPAGWEFKRLKWTCDYRISNVDKLSSPVEEPIRLCNYTDVYYNDFIDVSMNFMEATATKEEIERFSLLAEDVLLTKDSESWDDIGVPAMVSESGSSLVCGYHLALIRPRRQLISGRFLFRCLQSQAINRQFQIEAKGVTRFGLPKAAIGNALISVPSYQDQTQIADFLDRKTAQIDKLIEIKRRQIELLKEERTAIINHAVTKGLNPDAKMKESGVEWIGEIPEGWEVVKLKHVCTLLRDGTHLPPPRVSEGIPLLSVRNIVEGEFVNREDDSLISEQDFQILNKSFQVQHNDVLLAIVGATLGKVAIVPEMKPFHIQRSLAVFRACGDTMDFRYLAYFMRSSFFQELLWNNVGFSAQPGIYLGALANFRVVCPPLSAQLDIIETISKEEKKIGHSIESAENQIQLLQEYRTTLISDAVTGKIDVREEAA